MFAQGLGLVFSVTSGVSLALGATTVGWVVLGLLVVAATLESVFGFCLGCVVFGLLQRVGVVPESVCEACNDIWSRRTDGAAGPGAPVDARV